jgi:geranylgeranyl pyrophosphate synthase
MTRSQDPSVPTRLDHWRARIEHELERALESRGAPEPRLVEAMRRATHAGGKRLRPLLALAGCEAAGTEPMVAIEAAAAVELLHTYSLIHDDLPAMDDAQLRRGQPCVHVTFGEAIGILAGDALQTLAFEWLTRAAIPAERIVLQVRALAAAAGVSGMAGGQSLDLLASKLPHLDEHAITQIHRAKTGALILASIQLGAIAAGAEPALLQRFDAIGVKLGLAFQITDDVLDATVSTEQLGKTAGRDADQGKASWPHVLGLPAARARAEQLGIEALAAIGDLGRPAVALGQIARSLLLRTS